MIKVYRCIMDLYSGVGRFVLETPVYWVKFYRYDSLQFPSSGSSAKTIYWELISTENLTVGESATQTKLNEISSFYVLKPAQILLVSAVAFLTCGIHSLFVI